MGSQALLAQGKEEEAATAAERAATLDAGRTPEVTALARKAKAELAARRRREACRYGGMFESKRYEAASAAAAEEEAEAAKRDRARVAAAVSRHATLKEEDAAALSAWVDAGAEAVPRAGDGSVRARLARLVRAAAQAGCLEDGELRATLRLHGLGGALAAAGDPDAEGVSPEEAAGARTAAQLSRVKALVSKVKAGQALTTEELGVLSEYRCQEIARLQAQAELSADDRALLAKLQAQEALAQRQAEESQRVASDAERALKKLQSGERVGPRERFNLLRTLEGEQARLEREDDARGLRSEEAATLRQLKALFSQRSAAERMRKEQQALLAKLGSDAQRAVA